MDRRRFLQTTLTTLAMAQLTAQAAHSAPTTWTANLGHGFGLALHDYSDATLDVARDAGFTLIRTDFFWSGVETKRHVYDWTMTDTLMAGLAARNLRPQFVLGFNNPDIYGGNWMDGITMSFELNAYAAFCAAAAARYRDINPIWEIYNEPNRDNFWEPKANPAEYMTMAKRAIAAIRAVQPGAIIIAPALGHKMREPVLDLDFLEACLKYGLAPLIDAVSIHPYVDPELADQTYTAVAALLDQYPAGARRLPILSTEWGFATNEFVDEDLQADVLLRMFLVNLMHGIPVSIAYVAVDRTEAYVPLAERSYGIVRADYSPKAAFTALQDMNRRLAGFTFQQRLPSDPDDYLLMFSNNGQSLIAAWTAGVAHDVAVKEMPITLTSRPVFVMI